MKINKLVITVLICANLFLGCNRQTEIKGEVFIVKDEKVTKLAAIPIKIIKKEKVIKLFGDDPLPDADYSVNTDSDGKFSIKIPNGEYVAAADFTRIETEIFQYHYYWRVAFRAAGGENKIALDSTNVQSESKILDLPKYR